MSAPPSSLANGPSQRDPAGEQLWERPWSPDEMRRSSATWSLAADSGLFLYLEDFSQRMLAKTHDIEKQLDGLLRDTKATDCHLHTVFNDFLMLSNTQFIENRVYDEEVEEAMPKPEAPEKQPEQEKTREQKEAELIPKVQEAVNYGLRVLESAFEQLDIKAGNSDSEDEEAIDRVEPILEPKDLYLDRPLPYLIGSQLFMEQDNVGLGDLSSEEMSIDSERDSVIDSEEDKDEEQSDEDFDQDDTRQGSFTKQKSSLSDEEEAVDDEDEDSDIFGESDKEGDEEGKKISTGSASFADELAARIRGETPSKPEDEHSVPPSIPSKKRSKVKKDLKAVTEDKEEIFQPPPMEDAEHSLFGSKGGLFSGGRGLFDDDDEGDLFSEAPKQEAEESSSRALADDETVLSKPSKKIPAGAVSIFPENSLFGSPQDSDSLESRESRHSAQQNSRAQQKAQTIPKSTPGSGLFNDDEDDDDFFSGSAFKKSSSAGLEKNKQKKVLDLFGAGEDDEEGDIFSENFNSTSSGHSKKLEENVTQMPQKKLPAGATSMFSPGTTSLLQDAVRRHQPSVGDESQKPREDVTPVNNAKTPAKPVDKPQVRGLFSDDEDSQIFPSPTKTPPKPDPSPQIKQSKASKTPLSLFDDEEEQDLFASAPVNLKTSQAKNDTLQKSSKVASSSLFSDDEDQWMSSVPEVGKPVAKSTGAASSRSKQPAVKAPQKISLFDDDADDDSDLFAATKESSKKKPQRVSLLFEEEDEGDEDKGSLFSFKPSSSKPTPVEKAPSILDSQTKATPSPVKEEAKEATKQSLSDSSKAQGQPAGSVHLFGGIDVLGAQQTAAKVSSTLGNTDQTDAPPPMEEGPKPKKTVLSLFDDYDEEDDDEHEDPAHTALPPKTLPKKTQMPQEQWPSTTSTRVFQDEELLFSQTQQKDNDPDVDLFAPSCKSVSPKGSSAGPAANSLFGEDDEDDSFIAARPKVVQKPAVVIKSKEPSSRIGKLQVNLAIDPSSLLPGAIPRISGAASTLPHPSEKPLSPTEPFPSLSSSSASGSTWEGGISFDIPAQVTTLKSANKSRPKGAGHRRPQTRAARLAAQQSDASQVFDPSPPPVVHVPVRASQPVLSTHVDRIPAATEDTFKTGDLYATDGKMTSNSRTLEQTPKAASLFDSQGHDRGKKLFQDVKQTPVKRSTAVPFLDDKEEDFVAVRKDKDVQVAKESQTKVESPEHDIFQDEVDRKKAPKKAKERTLDASLFDDDIDIFADLTATTAPVEKKSKKRVETKSIFDDDMDDIFSSGPSKPVTKQAKSKRSAPAQEPSSSLFDDPLNALGGK